MQIYYRLLDAFSSASNGLKHNLIRERPHKLIQEVYPQELFYLHLHGPWINLDVYNAIRNDQQDKYIFSIRLET